MTNRVLTAVVLVLASIVGWELTRALPPVAGLTLALVAGTAFLWWHVRPGPARAERLALARMVRPIGASKWVSLSVVATIALIFGLSGFVESWDPAWPQSESAAQAMRDIVEYDTNLIGWIAVGLWAIGVDPFIGEVALRGYVQGALEHRWPPLWAILVPPAVLTVLTLVVPGPWPSILLLGLASAGSGFVAYRFQSVWPAVGVTAGSAVLYFALPFIHGDRLSNFGGLTPELLIPLSIALTSAGVLGWYLVFDRTNGPGARRGDAHPRGADVAGAHTSA